MGWTWSNIDWSATAAWVQAGGTIAAVWYSGHLARKAVEEAASQAEKARHKGESDARLMVAGIISAAHSRLSEVVIAIDKGKPAVARYRLWTATLKVEAVGLSKVDVGTLRDSRLISIFNSVATQIDYAVVCLETAISALEARTYGGLKVDPEIERVRDDLRRRLARRLENIERRRSEFTNVMYTPHDSKGPKAVVLGSSDDQDLEDL